MENILSYDTVIMEESDKVMESPATIGGGAASNPVLKRAHFLKPLVTFLDDQVFANHPSRLLTETTGAEPQTLPLRVTYRGWRKPREEWKTWVARMHSLHQSLWTRAGIRDAVVSSAYNIPRDEKVFLGFAQKWCCETNTFVFSWGEATITLEDMMVLGGYSILGDSVSSRLRKKGAKKTHKQMIHAHNELSSSTDHKVTQSKWMAKFKDSGSQIEHEAFLSLWLSMFVFPKEADYTVSKEVLPVSVHLARGCKLALAPAVLASIYRDLGLLKRAMVDALKGSRTLTLRLWAPLHLVQTWVWERFPTLKPEPRLVKPGEPRLARWHDLKRANSEDVSSLLDSLAEHFHWRPYVKAVQNLPSCEFYKDAEEWISIDDLNEGLQSFARCLRVSELVGLDNCIEQYLPHRVAIQFAMDQDIPDQVARANSNTEIAWQVYTRSIGDEKLYIPPRLHQPGITNLYMVWWNSFKSSSKHEAKPADRVVKEVGQSSSRKEPGFPPKCKREREEDHWDD